MRFFKTISRFNFPYFILGLFLFLLLDGVVLFRFLTLSSIAEIKPNSEISALRFDRLLSDLSLEEKVGQIIMVNFYGDDEEQMRQLFERCHVGGIMLKGENTKNKSFQDLKQQNQWLQAFSEKIPLWISVDQEGGQVSRLKEVLKNYPSPSELFRKKGVQGIEAQADYYAQKFKELGIQLNFSPVVDLVEKSNSIIKERTFSDSVQTNVLLGKIFINRFEKNELIAVPKHFPGYGNIAVDPHEALAIDSSRDLEKMERVFFPLTSAKLIMTSHVIYDAFDSDPATLSSRILGRLRKAGFTNLIITDDIQMKSITLLYDYEQAAIKAVRAGCDIVLSITKEKRSWLERAIRLHSALVQAYRRGELNEEDLNRRVEKILSFKLESNPHAKWTLLEKEKNLSKKRIVFHY